MLKIKVCGLRDFGNAANIAGTFPDFMGFIFHPGSVRYVGQDVRCALLTNLPQGIIKTGVFVNEEISDVEMTVSRYGLDAVQLHGSESAEYCKHFMKRGLVTIKAFGLWSAFDFRIPEPYMNCCNYFLFDTKSEGYGGSGRRFGWAILDKYKLDKPYFLSGGICYDDIKEIKDLRYKELFGVDINSRFELSPGIKDTELIRSFINEIKK
jgi:phosphoribosylanthranilate isomerase